MASINKVILVGNLGRDPDVRHLPSGDTVAQISVATSDRWKDKNGEQREATEWHRVAFFGRLAEIVERYLRKGSQVYIEGRLRTRNFTDKDGVEKSATEIVADNMQMLGAKSSEQQTYAGAPQPQRTTRAAAKPVSIFDDDIPF